MPSGLLPGCLVLTSAAGSVGAVGLTGSAGACLVGAEGRTGSARACSVGAVGRTGSAGACSVGAAGVALSSATAEAILPALERTRMALKTPKIARAARATSLTAWVIRNALPSSMPSIKWRYAFLRPRVIISRASSPTSKASRIKSSRVY